MKILLPNKTDWSFDEAFNFVQDYIISQLPETTRL